MVLFYGFTVAVGEGLAGVPVCWFRFGSIMIVCCSGVGVFGFVGYLFLWLFLGVGC